MDNHHASRCTSSQRRPIVALDRKITRPEAAPSISRQNPAMIARSIPPIPDHRSADSDTAERLHHTLAI